MGDVIGFPPPSPEQLQRLHEEYQICKRRDHVAKPIHVIDSTTGITWFTCQYCDTQYSEQDVRVLAERQTPQNRADAAQ